MSRKPPACTELLEPRAYLAGITFGAPGAWPVAGVGPGAVTIADFNVDGRSDVAVVLLLPDELSPAASVMLGNGNGTFRAPVGALPGGATMDVAAGDFNGDGKPDIANTDFLSPLLLGVGDGTFQPATGHVLFGAQLRAGDFTGDGKPDLASLIDNELSFQPGNGDGTFGKLQEFNLDAPGTALAAGDVDGDGFPEILAADAAQVYVVKPGGQDLAAVDRLPLPASRGPSGLALVTPAGASRPSLAVPLPDGGRVVLFAAAADGKFARSGVELATGQEPVQVASGDFDADGRPDLVTVNKAGQTVSVLAGQADGTFAAHADFPAGIAPDGVAVVDLNADDRPDLVVTDPAGGSVNVLMNTSEGSRPGGGGQPPGPGPGKPPPGPANLTASVAGQLPAAVVSGQKFKAAPVVTVGNAGDHRFKGDVTVTLYASADPTLDDADARVMEMQRRLKLKPGQGRAVKMKLGALPPVADGSYYVLAQVTESGGGSVIAAAPSTVTIAAPFVELTGSFAAEVPASLRPGAKSSVAVNVANAGNVPAAGSLAVSVALSGDAAAGGDDRVMDAAVKRVKLQPGQGKTIKVKFRVPADVAAASYYVVAGIDSQNAFAEPDEANNTMISAGTTAVG